MFRENAMSSKERENKRKEKKQKNQRRIKTAIWAVLAVVVIALIILKVCEVDFASIKNKITSDGGVSSAVTAENASYPYTLDSSKNVVMSALDSRLCVLTDTSCSVLNPADAAVQYKFEHGYSNPIMKTAGNYICLFDQGSDRLRVDSSREQIYETKADTFILTADISKKGNVIYAVKSNKKKSTVIVMNTSLKKLAELDIKEGYVVSTAIDPSGKKCAWAVVNSENAKLVTTVYTYNVGDEQPTQSFDFGDSILVDLKYNNSSNLYVVCTDRVDLISSQKKAKELFAKGSVNTVCCGYTKNNELLYAYSEYDNSEENKAVYITASGKLKTTVALNQRVKALSSSDSEMCVLFADKICTYSLTKGTLKKTSPCDDSVKSICSISSKLFKNFQQQIDLADFDKAEAEKSE